eukprot:scaffold90369_cov49-Attheya_sp.AAC.4
MLLLQFLGQVWTNIQHLIKFTVSLNLGQPGRSPKAKVVHRSSSTANSTKSSIVPTPPSTAGCSTGHGHASKGCGGNSMVVIVAIVIVGIGGSVAEAFEVKGVNGWYGGEAMRLCLVARPDLPQMSHLYPPSIFSCSMNRSKALVTSAKVPGGGEELPPLVQADTGVTSKTMSSMGSSVDGTDLQELQYFLHLDLPPSWSSQNYRTRRSI